MKVLDQVSTRALDTPLAVEESLEEVRRELAERRNRYEVACKAWVFTKREREKVKASAFLTAKGSVAARNAIADLEASMVGIEEEAAYVSQKAALGVLEAEATACQSLLKSQRGVGS